MSDTFSSQGSKKKFSKWKLFWEIIVGISVVLGIFVGFKFLFFDGTKSTEFNYANAPGGLAVGKVEGDLNIDTKSPRHITLDHQKLLDEAIEKYGTNIKGFNLNIPNEDAEASNLAKEFSVYLQLKGFDPNVIYMSPVTRYWSEPLTTVSTTGINGRGILSILIPKQI